eukprot:TRINITY_DN47495_c0_g1_i1.p1 TRINITY_DN47495_c0_g1~~TRINITY_DN47495_c0_g1_i1.p1  ORF type:complete len:898 (+),score=177.39 TRINITY_DN47495_c0_g1_i1:133-2826(+)
MSASSEELQHRLDALTQEVAALRDCLIGAGVLSREQHLEALSRRGSTASVAAGDAQDLCSLLAGACSGTFAKYLRSVDVCSFAASCRAAALAGRGLAEEVRHMTSERRGCCSSSGSLEGRMEAVAADALMPRPYAKKGWLKSALPHIGMFEKDRDELFSAILREDASCAAGASSSSTATPRQLWRSASPTPSTPREVATWPAHAIAAEMAAPAFQVEQAIDTAPALKRAASASQCRVKGGARQGRSLDVTPADKRVVRRRPGSLDSAWTGHGFDFGNDSTCDDEDGRPAHAHPAHDLRADSIIDVDAANEVCSSCGRCPCNCDIGAQISSPEKSAEGGLAASSPASPTRRKSTGSTGGKVRFCALYCKYGVITRVAKERGWLLIYGNPERGDRILYNCNIYWVDTNRISEVIPWVEPWVKLNHFPGMNDLLARKSGIAQLSRRFQKIFPEHFDFIPPSWVLPSDMSSFKAQFAANKARHTYIVKPDRGSRGRGIFITNEYDRIRTVVKALDEVMVAQRYIADPMLIDNFKFDLRLYVLVGAVPNKDTGSLEFKVFLFRDGLVRLCTTPYSPPSMDNESQMRMHLTNYAVNKNSSNFDVGDGDNDGCGSKRSLRWFLADFEERHGPAEADKLWHNLSNVCAKTLLVAQPSLDLEYHSRFPKDLSGGSLRCRSFELLGFDVMLDKQHKPWVIEVNCLPSYGTDSPLDEDIKKRVISQTFDICCSDVSLKDRSTYRLLAHRRRCGQDVDGKGAHAADGAAGVADGVEKLSSTQPDAQANLLEADSYKDFVKIYPPPNDPELAATYDVILDKARVLARHPSATGAPMPSMEVPEAKEEWKIALSASKGLLSGHRPAEATVYKPDKKAQEGFGRGQGYSAGLRGSGSAATLRGSSRVGRQLR